MKIFVNILYLLIDIDFFKFIQSLYIPYQLTIFPYNGTIFPQVQIREPYEIRDYSSIFLTLLIRKILCVQIIISIVYILYFFSCFKITARFFIYNAFIMHYNAVIDNL